jgi:FKBP-type peptidyl-prolyl cis-trans isomerase
MRKIWLAAVLFFIPAAGLLVADEATPESGNSGESAAPTSRPTTTTPSGLKIEILSAGDAVAEIGDRVWVHFEGRFLNGKVFESSYRDGEPVDIRLGDERLIAGWTEGLQGMRVGEKRRLTIPPQLGYGNEKHGSIPPKSTLEFDVELVGLKKRSSDEDR